MSGQRKALIIANDEYEQEALGNLRGPAADAEVLGRVLGDRQIGGFAVRVVRNEASYIIQAQIEELFSESRSDDLLLLHFSGHGLKSESGELFFAASNTRPNRLGSSAVSADFVQRCMRASRSRSVVLLLDCCYGGAFAQGSTVRAAGDVNVLDSFPQGRLGGGRGRAVITASNAMEYAFEGDQLADNRNPSPSVFTSALVEGLATGDADRDEDGWISLNELYDYVFDKVQEQNPHQTPSRHFELEGELYLARSRRRRIRPTPIPPDLQAAITDPNMYTRRGAVSELQARLASEELPVAAGAYEALADLARTDIGYVAEPAAAALSQAAVRPDKTELHFGKRQQGSAPPHRVVRLLGPPIARASVPRASHDWIRVNETAQGVDVSVDTTRAGTLRGSIALKGLTGEAVIAIDVEIFPKAAQTSTARRPSRPASQSVAAAIPIDQPEAGSAAKGRRAGRHSAEQDYQGAPEIAHAQVAGPHRDHASALRESATVPHATTLAAPSPARPSIRRSAAFTGIVTALLAGITGLIFQVLLRDSFPSGISFFVNLLIFAVPVLTAIVALTQIHRLVIIGFLQGMWWLAASALAANIVTITHLPDFVPGSVIAAILLRFTTYALGVVAAMLLLVSWRPAADRRQAPAIRGVSVMLLGATGLSQIAALILYVSQGQALSIFSDSLYYYILGSAGVPVVLAVTWYAMSLRAHALGGALILGWVTIAALTLTADITLWPWTTGVEHFCVVLEGVLLAIVVVLTVFYVREPSDLDSSANS